jgi:hypothetical protein
MGCVAFLRMDKMILNGSGGGSTVTGLRFEDKVSLKEIFENMDGVIFLQKHEFNKFMKKNFNRDANEILSKILLPDMAVISEKTIHIIEVKFQQTNGSVDEKLQTCLFKKEQYEKLAESTGKEVKYTYILNDWFKNKKYKDTLDFIINHGCHYFFNDDIPIDFFVNKEITYETII